MDEKVAEFARLLQFPEVQEVLVEIVRNTLIESNVFTRLNLIEQHLGADEFHCVGKDIDYETGFSEYEEEREPLLKISDQIAAIYEAIDSKETVVETVVLGGNKTETRARLLFKKLKDTPYINKKKFLRGPDVAKWLLNEVEVDLRTTKNGSRQAAKDVMEKCKELFGEWVRINPETSTRNKKRAYNIIEYVECNDM